MSLRTHMIRRRWPDARCVMQGEFGLRWREPFPDTSRPDCRFFQVGTGDRGADRSRDIRWLINRKFRLALWRCVLFWGSALMIQGLAAGGIAGETGLRLENRHLAIQFAPEESGLGVVSIEHRSGEGTPVPFVTASPEDARIWQIGLRGTGAVLYIENNAPCRRTIRLHASKGEALLRWDGLDAGEERGVLDVAVRVRLRPDSPASLWKISVANRSRKVGVWDVSLPWFKGFGEKGTMDIATPGGEIRREGSPRAGSIGVWGMLDRGTTSSFSGIYPGIWPMQFIIAGKGDRGLLLSLRDPEAWIKQYEVEPGHALQFKVFAPDSGKPGTGFQSPMELCIEAYRGSWWTGAKRYRAWALTAPWARRGPIAARKDYPDTLRRVCLWWCAPPKSAYTGDPAAFAQRMRAAASCFDVPLAVHWYGWHHCPFDVNYPEYFPAKAGFGEKVRELVSGGFSVAPYVNLRLWDIRGAGFASAKPAAAKQVGGKNLYVENYGTAGGTNDFAAMCPATRFWQRRMVETVRRLWTEYGPNAVYVDQVGSMTPVRCFDPAHGHPLGGGHYWAKGYRDMLRPLADEAASKGFFLATEGTAEAYLDTIDAFLLFPPDRHSQDIPLFPAVYSGYAVCFGSVTYDLSPDAFCRIQGRDLLWGCQLGGMNIDAFLGTAGGRKSGELLPGGHGEYLLECARYRRVLEKFLLEGELLGEIPVRESHPPAVDGGRSGRRPPLPSLATAVWRAPDGHIALLIANLSSELRSVEYDFDGAAWGISSASGTLVLTRIHADRNEKLGEVPEAFWRKDNLPPRGILALELSPR